MVKHNQEQMQQIQHLFIIKTLNKVRIKCNSLNLTRTSTKKSTGNIILNAFSLRTGRREGHQFLLLFFNTTGISTKAKKQDNKTKGTHIGNKVSKTICR